MELLQGEKIRLRPLEIIDLDILYTWENNLENWKVSDNLTPFSRFYLEQYILNAHNNIYQDSQIRLIIENFIPEPVGIIDLYDFDPHHRRAGVGILVGQRFRRKGYASDALNIIIKYASETLNLHQLYCSIEHGNAMSLDMFLKSGFVITGTRTQWNLRGKQWVNEDFLQLIL